MTTLTTNYGSTTTIALDLSSLATSSTFVAGIESAEIDNTSNKYVDCIVQSKGIVGHASTAPTVGQMIAVYVWGSDTSLATTPLDTLDGTSSTETLSHISVLNSLRFAAAPTVTVATAALSYYVLPFSVARLGLAGRPEQRPGLPGRRSSSRAVALREQKAAKEQASCGAGEASEGALVPSR